MKTLGSRSLWEHLAGGVRRLAVRDALLHHPPPRLPSVALCTKPVHAAKIQQRASEVFAVAMGNLFGGMMQVAKDAGRHQAHHRVFTARSASRYPPMHAQGRFNAMAKRPSRTHSHSKHFGFSPAQVGLSPARSFSSTKQVSDAMQHVPFALRALVDVDGIDERKWGKNAFGRGSTKDDGRVCRGGKGIGRERLPMQQQFDIYWTTTALQQGSSSSSASASSFALVFSLEPSLALFTASSLGSNNVDSSYRIISPASLRAFLVIQQAYVHHSQRISRLSNRLVANGVFEDAHVAVEIRFTGSDRKEVWITFADGWSRKRVEAIVGEQPADGFWRIIDFDEEQMEIDKPTAARSEAGMSDILDDCLSQSMDDGSMLWTISDDGYDFEEDDDRSCGLHSEMELHDQTMSTFIFPTLTHYGSTSSLDLTGSMEEAVDRATTYESGVMTFLDELDDVERRFSRYS